MQEVSIVGVDRLCDLAAGHGEDGRRSLRYITRYKPRHAPPSKSLIYMT
jgi:hypothetical protein